MKPKPPLERAIVLAILQYLQATHPQWCWIRCEPPSAVRMRVNRGKAGTAWKVPEDQWGDGVADILGLIYTPSNHFPFNPYSRGIAIEVKRPGQKQRPSQVAFQARWERAGGLYMVADGVDAVERQLKSWGI